MSLTINSANNRFATSFISSLKLKKTQFQGCNSEDNTSQLSNQDLSFAKQYSVSSTVDSPLLSAHRRFESSTSDEEQFQQSFEEQKCQDYHEQGYCLKGAKCEFRHQKNQGIINNCKFQKMIQNFPQLSISWSGKRFTSFLQEE